MSALCFALSTPLLSRKPLFLRPQTSKFPTPLMTADDLTDDRFPGEYAPIILTPHPPRNLRETRSRQQEVTGPVESQCGQTWDAQDVEQYDGSLGVTRAFVSEHQAPVGVLRWRTDIEDRFSNPGNVAGNRWCTGTLISDDIFLSAGHCFSFGPNGDWVFPTYDDGSRIPDSELVRELTVEFNYQRDPSGRVRTPVAYPVEALVESTFSGGIDFGVLRVGRTNNQLPGQRFGTTPVSDVDAVIGDVCCIIGHPEGCPKSIEAGTIDRESSTRIRYGDIDTLPGNSGSGVLRSVSGDVIGVHTNGGCNTTAGFNSGMKISAILDRSPTVRRIAGALQWGPVLRVPGWFGHESQGGGITFANITGSGSTDIVTMHIDNPFFGNSGHYRVGKNLQVLPNGSIRIQQWTDPIQVPGWFGWENQGADVTFGNIRSATSKDLVIFHIDNPPGENHGYYRIGFGLDSNGVVTGGWTSVIEIPGWFGAENQGGGIALGSIKSRSSNDLVVMHLDNPSGDNAAHYRVGFDLGPDGVVRGGWSKVMKVPGWFGWENQGGGVELFDTNGNGKLDIIIFHIDNPRTDNHGFFRVGRDLNERGEVTGGWSNLVEVPGWFGWHNQGGGLAVHRFGQGEPTIAVFHIDNPGGENSGHVRFGTGTLAI